MDTAPSGMLHSITLILPRGTSANLRLQFGEGFIQPISGTLLLRREGHADLLLNSEACFWAAPLANLELYSETEAEIQVIGSPIDRLGRMNASSYMRWEDAAVEQFDAGLSGRSYKGSELSLFRFEVDSGYEIRDLSHPEEQISFVQDGSFVMYVDDRLVPLSVGDAQAVRSNQSHGGSFLRTNVVLFECFQPARITGMTVQI